MRGKERLKKLLGIKAVNDDSLTGGDGVYVATQQLLALRQAMIAQKHRVTRQVSDGLSGDSLSKLKGRGVEFEDVRPYLPGDDLRHVDWRVIAKTGVPYTRRYSEDRDNAVIVAVDQRANMFFGSSAQFKSFTAACVAALRVWDALENGCRVGGVVASDTIESIAIGNARQSSLRFIESLVTHNNSLSVGSNSTHHVSDILQHTLKMIVPGAIVTVVSDFHDLDENAATLLASIALRAELNLLKIVDPLETEILIHGRVGISNQGNSTLATLTSGSRRNYRQQRADADHRLNELVGNAGVELVEVDTGWVA